MQRTAELILTLFRHRPREVRFVGPLLGIDPDAEDAALRARLEAFFRGVRFCPADRAELYLYILPMRLARNKGLAR
jgi:hypothetical protein